MYANEETIQAIIDETLLRIPDKDEHKQFWKNTCIDITNFENKSIENLEPGAYIHYGALDSVYDLFPTNSFSVKRNPETVAILTSCEMFVLEIDRRYKQLEYQVSENMYITFTDFAGKIYVYNATDIDGDTGNFSRQFDFLWRSGRRDGESASGVKSVIPWYNQSETFRKYVDNEYIATTFGYNSIVHKKGSSEYVYSFPEETGTIALLENIPTNLSELTNDSGYITINSIGNGTLTITQNGTNKGTFSANQSGNASINLTDTTYESKSAASGGTAVSLVTTGEKYTWNAKSNFSGAYADLTGLPTLGTAAAKDIPASGNASTTQVVLGNDTRLTNRRPASDVYAWAKASTKPSYSYSEISGTPTIPTVNNGTLTIQKNGTNVATFSANQSGNSTANITVPTKLSDLTNDSGYITIGSVGNGTLTITQNGTSKGTFSANQSGNASINLTDTTYESKSAASGGTAVSLVTTGEKYTWNAKSNFSGAYADLTGLPTLGTAAAKDIPASGNASTTQVVLGNDTRLTNRRPASDVYAWAKASTKPSYTASEVDAVPRIVAKIPVTISPSAGWRRICKITYGNYGYENGFVTISGGWNNGVPSSAIISICCMHHIASMNLIHNISRDGMIQQVRLVNIYGPNYWFDAYMKGRSGEVSEQYFIFFGNFDISDIQNSATIITDGTASASVNLTTTTVTGTLITSGNIGSQSVSYANTAGSAPASDVYAWAKASTKPSYSYSEISGAPTVNNGTLTIQKNGTNVATFTANQSRNSTANITVPTKLSELTNDSGYITSSGSCANADALQNSTPDESTGASTIVKRTAAGQVNAVFYNMSGGADNINSFTSNVAFVSPDGYIRKTSKANFSTWLLRWTKLGSTTGNTVLTYTGTYTEFCVILDLGFYAETFYFVASALGGNRYFFGGTTNTSDGSSWVLRAGRSNSTYSFKADRVHQDGTDYTSQINVSVYAR